MIFCWGIRSCNELILEIRTPGVLKICWWNILREILKRFVTADLKMPCLELFLKYFQYFALLVTVILPPEIIKYYRNLFRFTSYMIFFSSFLVTFLWVSITFECYHIHSKCNHANILFNVWFTTYVTFIIFFIICNHDKSFVKVFFHNLPTILVLFKNCPNKSMKSPFTLINSNRFSKSIVNAHNLSYLSDTVKPGQRTPL